MNSIINSNIKSYKENGTCYRLLDYSRVLWEYSGKTTPNKIQLIQKIICKEIVLLDHFTLEEFVYFITKSKDKGLISLIYEFDVVYCRIYKVK